MQPKRIQEILQKDINKVEHAAEAIAPNFRPEDIHQFRVWVKKLRALMHFINSVKSQPELKLTKSFKRLYSIAGALRDAHLKYETLTGRELRLPQYYNNLTTIVQRNKAEWEKRYSKQVIDKLRQKTTDYFDDLHPADLAFFFEQKIKKIKKINNATPDDEHIHEMRKLIKDLVYVTAFAQKKWKDAGDVVARIPHKQLTNLSELIGRFNDGSILLHELSSFSSMGMQHAEETAMAGYLEQAMARHNLLRKDLLRQIGEFVDSVEGGLG